LNSNEEGVHSHEEKRTLNVLPTSRSVEVRLPEQNTDKDTSTNGGEQLHVGGLGKTDNIVEVSSGEKSPLEAPWLHGLSFFGVDLHSSRISVSSIIAEVGVDILVIEVLDTLLIGVKDEFLLLFLGSSENWLLSTLFDGLLVNDDILTVDFFILNLSDNRLTRHNVHEVISGIAIFGARETNGLEIVNGLLTIVVIDNLTTGDQKKLIELVESFSVRLMDSRYNSFTIFVGKLLKHTNDLGSCP